MNTPANQLDDVDTTSIEHKSRDTRVRYLTQDMSEAKHARTLKSLYALREKLSKS